MRRAVSLVQSRGKWLVVSLCLYEVGAILSHRAPTLTEVSAQRRWVGPVLVGALAIHLARSPRVRAQVEGCICVDIGD